jgi:hypothetical protein
MEPKKIPGAEFTIRYVESRNRWIMTCSKHEDVEFANSVDYGLLLNLAINYRCEKCIKEHYKNMIMRRCLL